MLLFNYPIDLVRGKVFPLLTIKDLVKLDDSMLNHCDRQHLKCVFSEFLFSFQVAVDDSALLWLESRKITPESVKFLQSAVGSQIKVARHAKVICFAPPCSINESTAMSILGQSKFLRVLIVESAQIGLTDEMVGYFSANCPHLQDVSLGNQPSITNTSMRGLAHNCTKLRSVEISRCNKITDEGVGYLVRWGPYLQHLIVSFCIQLTDSSFIAIAAYGKQLKTLHAGFVSSITHDAMVQVWGALPGLTSVDLSFCTRLGEDTLIQLAQKCRGLECLVAQIFPGLQDRTVQEIAKCCPRLHTVDFSKSAITLVALQALVAHCPNLRHLRLDSCPAITDSSVLFIAQHCPQLVEFDIAANNRVLHPASLVTLAQSCPLLEILRVNILQNAVTDAVLDALSQHCPRLRFLGTMLCYKISDEAVRRMRAQYGKQLSVQLPDKSVQIVFAVPI